MHQNQNLKVEVEADILYLKENLQIYYNHLHRNILKDKMYKLKAKIPI